ncbi:ATPase, partial [Pseudomonas syringae pv. tagetis]
ATEALSSVGEALKQRIKLLEAQLEDQDNQREGVEGQQGSLDKRLEQMAAQTAQEQSENEQLQEQLKSVFEELTTLKA